MISGTGHVSHALITEFKAGEKYSLADIKDKMGDPTYDLTIAGTGVVVWVDGCDSEEEAKKSASKHFIAVTDGKNKLGIIIILKLEIMVVLIFL